jgi:PAS domain S-box-containing protein
MISFDKFRPYLKETILGTSIVSCIVGIIWVFLKTFSLASAIDAVSASASSAHEIIPLLENIQDFLILSAGLILLLAFSLAFCLWYFINRQIKIVRASALIRKSHERYRFFTEGPPSIGIVRFDLIDFRVKDANRAALRLFGMSRGEITRRRLTSLIASDDRKTFLQTMADLQAGKRNAETVVKLDSDISENSFISWHISSLRVPNSEPEAIAIVLDVTHKVKAQEERLEKERLAGVLEMAGATAHELNQPLQVVSGITWMMLQKLAKEDPNYEKAEKIYKEVERMSDIAKKISAISSYKVKKYVGKTRIIDIDKAASSPERNRRPTT